MKSDATHGALKMNRSTRCLLTLGVGILLIATSNAQDPTRIIRTGPRPKVADFSGSEVLRLLGIPAAKAEILLNRSYRSVRAELVVGNRVGASIEETPLAGSAGAPLFPPDNKVTVGFAVFPEKRLFKLIVEMSTVDVPMPEGVAYDFPSMNPAGIYEDGLVIFAYEARNDEKPVRGKADMNRYLGVRIRLSDEEFHGGGEK